ncbi:hypothetical protein GE09DRAFT_619909 [Coniochaeta sp. 2T2.1]|nr:hypothetical protein GE09DRAFT_619909 [Coniochaeta sp. 2T2.1]
MDDLNRTLTSLELQRLGAGKALRRFWKSVVALTVEKEIAEKLQKVDRLNNEVNRQIGITVLQLQATVSDKPDKASAAATDDTSEVIDAVEANCRQIEATIQDRHTLTTGHLAEIASTTRGVAETVSDVRTDVAAAHINVTRLAEDLFVSHQMLIDSLADSERRLRDDIISVVLGRKHDISIESRKTSQDITEPKQRVVQDSVRRQLMRCPSSLAEAAASLRPGGHLRAQRCRCRRPFRKFTDTTFWALSFRAEESSEHWPECRYAKSGARSWAYSARAALTPFLNLTLELAIGATARGTTWSLASPLRFHGTVRRSKSPLFQAFDKLPSSCVSLYAIKNEEGDYVVMDEFGETSDGARFVIRDLHHYYPWEDSLRLILPDLRHGEGSRSIYVRWDIDAVRCRLKDLSRQIRRMVQQGVSVGDVDEQGLSSSNTCTCSQIDSETFSTPFWTRMWT